MSDSHPFEQLGPPPDVTPEPPGAPTPDQPPAIREPFWGYSDVALFIVFLVVSAAAALGLVGLAESTLHLRSEAKVAELLAAQSLIYVLAFGALALLFRVNYNQPFWRSLGWKPFRTRPLVVMMCGIGTAVGVFLVAALIRTPATRNRITEMLEDPKSLVLVAIFGLTIGPLAEELAFRGFLQPLLVRTFGPVPGIIAAAIPFGLLHFQEYGNSWRHALVLSLAGAAFGWMRYRTGSTAASTLMHSAYNALEFLAYFVQQKELRHT